MGRFVNSLRGQLVLLVIVALVIAQAVSLWLFVGERGLAVRAALGLETADRAANVTRLLEQAPESLQSSILRAADSPLVRFSLDPAPVIDHRDHAGGGAAEARVRALLGDDDSREIRVEVHRIRDEIPPMPGMPPDMVRMHRQMMGAGVSNTEMRLSIALIGGQWLNVETRFHQPALQWPWVSIISFGLTAALILVALFWFVLTRLAGPLYRLSQAANRLGRGEGVEELDLTGPSEVRDLTRAFNHMQARLTRFISDRTRLLAALGHDLRSPLTAMRVRAELVEDDETRDRLIGSIGEMQTMVDSTLAFARGLAESDTSETVDLNAFLTTLIEDISATGDTIVLDGAPGIHVTLRPNAMRRAMRNVIENAVRYGGEAHISVGRTDVAATISVADKGPGIPEEDFDRVFEPFLRLEASRSRETGGSGLGLSIARTIIHAHGGAITLENRPEGGLLVTITIPLDSGQFEPS